MTDANVTNRATIRAALAAVIQAAMVGESKPLIAVYSYTPDENEIQLPGVAIWGIDPEPILRTGKLDKKIEGFSVNNDNFSERTEGQILLYSILIDCEARQSGLIDIMTRIVRKALALEILWVNGRMHEVGFAGNPTETRPPLGVDIIPKIQYSMNIEVVENINDRVVLPKTTTTNLTVDINGG